MLNKGPGVAGAQGFMGVQRARETGKTGGAGLPARRRGGNKKERKRRLILGAKVGAVESTI